MGFHRINNCLTLLLIRDGKAITWADLCRVWDLDPEQFHTGHSILAEQLENLRDAGLVEYQLIPGRYYLEAPFIDGEIRVSELWRKIQFALRLSLKQLAALDPDHSAVVRPYWGKPPDMAKHYDVFVVMPFAEALRPVYEDHIKQVVSSMSLSVGRADDLFSTHAVMADVWSGIANARMIVADCTGRNPNVFYEIGLSHVLGKPVILITQSAEDIPFDLKSIRYIQYTFTPRGMADFEATLRKTIQQVLEE